MCNYFSKHTLFTSLDGLYSVANSNNASDLQRYEKVSFIGQHNYTLTKLVIEYSLNGLIIGGNESEIYDIIIRRNTSTGVVGQSIVTIIGGSNILDNDSIGFSSSTGMKLDKSIIARNTEACYLLEASAILTNNFWIDNGIAIRMLMGSTIISNNAFDRNVFAVSLCAASPQISENNFFNNIYDIETSAYWSGGYFYCSPVVWSNNFFSSTYYVYLRGLNPFYGYITSIDGVSSSQNYPNNYLQSSDIQPHIYDANYPGSGLTYSVSFDPRRSTLVPGAGIRF